MAEDPREFKAPERIDTARLVLRRPRQSDAEAIFAAYAGDAEATRYLSWPRHLSIAQTRAFLDFSDDHWATWPAGPYLIESKADRCLAGGSGLVFDSPWCASTGYVLAPRFWGHGYATEALAAMVDLAARTGVIRLYAQCHADHEASRRVLEKGGFEREGLLRRQTVFPNLGPGPCDAWMYARILRA